MSSYLLRLCLYLMLLPIALLCTISANIIGIKLPFPSIGFLIGLILILTAVVLPNYHRIKHNKRDMQAIYSCLALLLIIIWNFFIMMFMNKTTNEKITNALINQKAILPIPIYYKLHESSSDTAVKIFENAKDDFINSLLERGINGIPLIFAYLNYNNKLLRNDLLTILSRTTGMDLVEKYNGKYFQLAKVADEIAQWAIANNKAGDLIDAINSEY